MTKVALVVVDLQEDFLPDKGSLAVPHGRDIITSINRLIDARKYKWLAIIATQDWHPADHCSFASQHGVPPYTQLEFKHPLNDNSKTMTQYVWPDHCVQESYGATLEESFLTLFNTTQDVPKKIVQKGYLKDREYYSCFQDCWKLHKTEMEDYLKELNITDVVFVGLAYDFCVLNSAVDCAAAGFNTYVIKLCTKSVYPEKEADTDKLYKDAGVKQIAYDDPLFTRE